MPTGKPTEMTDWLNLSEIGNKFVCIKKIVPIHTENNYKHQF